VSNDCVNLVILEGFTAKDLIVETSKNGNRYIRFSIGLNKGGSKKNAEGNWESKGQTSWIQCVFFIPPWKATKDLICTKGTRIEVRGELETSSWVGKNGERQYKTQVICHRITLLPSIFEVQKEQQDHEDQQLKDKTGVDWKDVTNNGEDFI